MEYWKVNWEGKVERKIGRENLKERREGTEEIGGQDVW
jgi:hypothetical protein